MVQTLHNSVGVVERVPLEFEDLKNNNHFYDYHYFELITKKCKTFTLESTYRRSTIFHCHLIFVGRRENEHENIQHNTKQWYHNAFSGPKLKNKKR